MDPLRIVSVNVASAEPIDVGGERVLTGIHKRPVEGAVRIGDIGLDGDAICDTEHHGGADQAVYAYGAGDYAWWSRELGEAVEPGTFGDNLTIQGLPEDMHVGDRLLIGNVILEATSPRIPCRTLASRMNDSAFGVRFRRAERPGFYFRVLNGGEVSAGETVTVVEDPSSTVTMLELYRLSFEPAPRADALEKALAAPIAETVRSSFEKKLAAVADQG